MIVEYFQHADEDLSWAMQLEGMNTKEMKVGRRDSMKKNTAYWKDHGNSG